MQSDWSKVFWELEFCQNFLQWNTISNMISHFRLCPRKNNDKFFQNAKNNFLPTLPIFGQIEIFPYQFFPIRVGIILENFDKT